MFPTDSIFDAIPASIAVLNADGVIIRVNDGWRRFGASNKMQYDDAALGVNYLEQCERTIGSDTADSRLAASGIRAVLTSSSDAFTMEYPVDLPSGRRWYRMMVAPLPHDGSPGVVVMHVDITGSQDSALSNREADRAARESTQRLGFALTAADIGDWSLDLRTNVAHRSLRHDQCFGYAVLQPSWTYETFLAHVDVTDRAHVDACFQRALAGHGEYDVEFTSTWADGSTHWLWTRGRFYFNDAGEAIRAAGIVADITDRKSANEAMRAGEELFAGAFEHAQIGIGLIGKDGRYMRVNQALCESVGHPEASLLGESFHALVHPDDVAQSHAIVARLADGELNACQQEQRFIHADGHIVTALLHFSLVRDVAGAPEYQIVQFQDISVRKRAQEEAERTLQQLNEVQRVARMGGWDFVVATELITWSPELYSLLERDPRLGPPATLEEAVALFDADGAERHQAHVAAAINTGESQYYELSMRRRSGVRAYFDVVAVPRKNPAGAVVALYGTIQDVTPRREAEVQLVESEHRLEIAAESARLGIWDWNIERNTLVWDRKMYELYAADPDAAGDPWTIYRSQILLEDSVRMDAAAARALKSESSFHSEFRIVWPDGDVRYLETHASLQRSSDGTPVRMIGVNSDITERKRVESAATRLADIVASSDDAIIGTDTDGRITSWNRAAVRIFGYAAEESIGTPMLRLFPADRAEEEIASLVRVQRGENLEHFETIRTTKDGRTIDVAVTMSPVRDASGSVVGVSKIARDISERKKLEKQFLRAQRMESVGMLAGGIAHDLNNALAPIILSIDLLKMSTLDEQSRDLLSTIYTSAHHGAEMVRQLLLFARGVEGKRLEVKVARLVTDIARIATDTFLKHFQIRTAISDEVWSVSGDATQLHQVLMNLCVNARDAMPSGGTLSISAENITLDAQYAGLDAESAEGPHVLIQVEDSGIGMTTAVIDKIFEPFYTTKELGTGTGLGLSTTLAIVKSHGGFMRVQSEPGRGTRFSVFLPAMRDASHTHADRTYALPRGRGELVLVVDDESSVRHITQQTLEAFGYRVVCAQDGTEAVAVYAERRSEIAVVVMDLMMPVMDGATTIRVLRRLNRDVQILAVSGLSASEPSANVAGLGVGHFLSKPYTAEALLKTLRAMLSEQVSRAG